MNINDLDNLIEKILFESENSDFTNDKGVQFDRERHGGLYDRGRADAWYGRRKNPHWYPEGTGKGKPITDLTPEEVEEYLNGYEDMDERKDWGGFNEVRTIIRKMIKESLKMK